MHHINHTFLDLNPIQRTKSRNYVRKLAHYIGDQFAQLQLKMLLVRVLLIPLPKFIGGHLRGIILRAAGFDIGNRVGFQGTPRIYGRGDLCKLLHIGDYTWININCHFDLSAPITIGKRVGIGPEVMIMTGTHEVGTDNERVGKYIAYPVTIEDGAWIGSRCTLMPGVTIGRGSIVAAGTVVTRDVPPNMVVSGTQRMPLEKWQLFLKNGSQASPATDTES